MRKIVLLVVAVLLLTGAASAQLGLSLGAGFNVVTPVDDFADRASTGWGLSAQAKLGVPIITLTGAVEYFTFGKKEFTGGSSESWMWGFNAGGRFTLFPFLYAGAEIGTYWENSTITVGGAESDGSITRGSFAPIIGVEFLGFDVNARYFFIDKTSFTAIRATYWF